MGEDRALGTVRMLAAAGWVVFTGDTPENLNAFLRLAYRPGSEDQRWIRLVPVAPHGVVPVGAPTGRLRGLLHDPPEWDGLWGVHVKASNGGGHITLPLRLKAVCKFAPHGPERLREVDRFLAGIETRLPNHNVEGEGLLPNR